jgi:hypothetical protein
LKVNLFSVSALEDVGYCTLFKRGHVFICREGVNPVEPQWLGDRVDRLYMLQGQPSGYNSASDEEKEASESAVGPRIQSCILREERESLLTTGKRLSWCDQTDAQGGVDSPRSSEFKADVRRSFGSSFVQVLRMDPGSEGAPPANSVMGPDDGDSSEGMLAFIAWEVLRIFFLHGEVPLYLHY